MAYKEEKQIDSNVEMQDATICVPRMSVLHTWKNAGYLALLVTTRDYDWSYIQCWIYYHVSDNKLRTLGKPCSITTVLPNRATHKNDTSNDMQNLELQWLCGSFSGEKLIRHRFWSLSIVLFKTFHKRERRIKIDFLLLNIFNCTCELSSAEMELSASFERQFIPVLDQCGSSITTCNISKIFL